MITKSDWQSVNQQMLSDGRKNVEPPTSEEMLAYSRGELSAEDEARVRERLIAYPELVRTLTEPFPSEGAEPGDPDYLTNEEFAMHWKALQERDRGTAGRNVVAFWRWSTAIAAALALTFGVLLWRASDKLSEPRAVAQLKTMTPEGDRGASTEPAATVIQGDAILLVIQVRGLEKYPAYRLEMVDAASGRRRWKSDPLTPVDENPITVHVPRRFLTRDAYRIVMYGVARGGEEKLATYLLPLP